MYLRIDSHRPTPVASCLQGAVQSVGQKRKVLHHRFPHAHRQSYYWSLKVCPIESPDAFTNPIAMSPSIQHPYTLDRDTHWPIGGTTYSPDRLYTLISEALLVYFANRYQLVMFSCGTKPVLVDAIVYSVSICFVYSLSCLDTLPGGGEL